MKNKIKILYTIPNFDTAGSGKVVYDLVNNIDKTAFSPEICCHHNKGAYFNEIVKLGVPIHIFDFTTDTRPLFSFFYRVLKIASFFRKHKFDIIHSWHWSSDFTEPLAAKFAGVKWIYTKKAMSWGNVRNWSIRSFLATKIILLNKDMKNQFFSKIKDAKLELIYLGVDLVKYIPQVKKRETPLGLRFSEKDFVIVSVANLVPIKGIEYLIEAVDKSKNKNVKLLIVGNNKNEYGQKLMKENNNKNISFIDKVMDVRPYHAVADLFVIPTKTSWEGLPVSPLEAMASQRMVIGSDSPGVRDVLENFKDFLFKPASANSILAMLDRILAMSTQERNNLALEQRKDVVHRFDFSLCMDKHEILYKKIISK